jgi:hypothetical protein
VLPSISTVFAMPQPTAAFQSKPNSFADHNIPPLQLGNLYAQQQN